MTAEEHHGVEEYQFTDAYCYLCTERIEFCRCPAGEGANRL